MTEEERRAIQSLRDRDGMTFAAIAGLLGRKEQSVRANYLRDRERPDFACGADTPPLPRERTLVLFKPDAVRRRLVGKLMGRFEYIGLDLIISRRTTITGADFVHRHHPDLVDKHGPVIAAAVVKYMTSGPLIATIWEGYRAIDASRRIIGSTFPAEAARGTIRRDFSQMSRDEVLVTTTMTGNLVHGSRTANEAKREIALWFGAGSCGR
ncbi:nucleoside-diphosphate kinase [Amycolatopsis roodepoortensis]|uniref:nucleoside-diphosphate kinase n=1 Tax=Amycolatopsis roodepoortensis TaxID=700274 RepID=A0ABR9LIM8_9PSEU|nr:nucleoside-diphosphate kinase [Amycolatopsis roodepoortensis]MBE1580549.1 nucleoside-diphosphate kinase [Amycolatopsis roodepoortensis]